MLDKEAGNRFWDGGGWPGRLMNRPGVGRMPGRAVRTRQSATLRRFRIPSRLSGQMQKDRNPISPAEIETPLEWARDQSGKSSSVDTLLNFWL